MPESTQSTQPASGRAETTGAPPLPVEESTSRKAFITTIISIFLSPISVALGFYLNHSLQKPELFIESIEQTYSLQSHIIPESVISSLHSLPWLEAKIRDVITQKELMKGDATCVDWLDGNPWKDSCFETVIAVSRGLQGSLTAVSSSPMPRNMADAIPTPGQIQEFNAALKNLTTWLSMASADTKEVRTGQMCFSVNILNSGDFDGVVFDYGKLILPKGELSIYAEKFTVIKAHGYKQVDFCFGEPDESTKTVQTAWEDSIKAHEETPFEIVLSTGDKTSLSIKSQLW
ncbi:hypothetical protein [Pseudomonas sp. NPDC089569]|uniref:hypothetical protein n=1 Tax=Pseudomonas sp. NPDC089569 TaxID=3390722 RepID=UPI003CFE3849